jgi:hypothetical protein
MNTDQKTVPATENAQDTVTKVKNPSKTKSKGKSKTKQLDKTNLAKVGKKAAANQVERETKYIYPEKVKSAREKKIFRRTARAAAAKFKKELDLLAGKTDKKSKAEIKRIQSEQSAFNKQTYTPVKA